MVSSLFTVIKTTMAFLFLNRFWANPCQYVCFSKLNIWRYALHLVGVSLSSCPHVKHILWHKMANSKGFYQLAPILNLIWTIADRIWRNGLFWYVTINFTQVITCPRIWAKCADSHDTAHVQSLNRAFALHWYILLCQIILLADSEGPDQTARPRSLIRTFTVRICTKPRFRLGWLICKI